MVEILLATYNGEKYISSLLDSLINQTYQDFKIIANDDCSTDKTFDILKDYELKFPDKIKVYQNENQSGNAKNNFFRLMEYTDSDYIMFCDQDDIWKNDKIEKTLKLMIATENREKDVPVLVHTDLSVVDENLNVINPSYFKLSHIKNETKLNRAVVQNCVTGCSVMINKSLLELVKNTNDEKIIMHDWWAYLVASAFGKIAFLNESTILYRQHKNNQVGAKELQFRSRKELKNSLNLTYKQAEYFYKIYNASLAQIYANLKKHSKIKRICTIFKYKFFKHSLLRIIIQLLMC